MSARQRARLTQAVAIEEEEVEESSEEEEERIVRKPAFVFSDSDDSDSEEEKEKKEERPEDDDVPVQSTIGTDAVSDNDEEEDEVEEVVKVRERNSNFTKKKKDNAAKGTYAHVLPSGMQAWALLRPAKRQQGDRPYAFCSACILQCMHSAVCCLRSMIIQRDVASSEILKYTHDGMMLRKVTVILTIKGTVRAHIRTCSAVRTAINDKLQMGVQ